MIGIILLTLISLFAVVAIAATIHQVVTDGYGERPDLHRSTPNQTPRAF